MWGFASRATGGLTVTGDGAADATPIHDRDELAALTPRPLGPAGRGGSPFAPEARPVAGPVLPAPDSGAARSPVM